jgi:protein-tyrosine phosphatase
MDPRDRLVPLDGCLNFRDLGGYPAAEGRRLRWGLVYRSDSLHALTARDLERLEDELRIRTVVDLRTSGERAAEPSRGLGALSLSEHHLPLYDGTEGARERPQLPLDEIYFLLLQFAEARVVRVLHTLADAKGAAVFHCAAGKDRTGVVAAALLGVLGVDDAAIVDDYALTRQNIDGIVARLKATQGYQRMLELLPADTLHAEPDTMRRLLERVRARWGGFQGWAEQAGLPKASRARLEQRLLE